jgi:hypothetical protein
VRLVHEMTLLNAGAQARRVTFRCLSLVVSELGEVVVRSLLSASAGYQSVSGVCHRDEITPFHPCAIISKIIAMQLRG